MQDATKVAKETRAANAKLAGLMAPSPIIDAQTPKGTNVSTVSNGVKMDDISGSIDADGDHYGTSRQSRWSQTPQTEQKNLHNDQPDSNNTNHRSYSKIKPSTGYDSGRHNGGNGFLMDRQMGTRHIPASKVHKTTVMFEIQTRRRLSNSVIKC